MKNRVLVARTDTWPAAMVRRDAGRKPVVSFQRWHEVHEVDAVQFPRRSLPTDFDQFGTKLRKYKSDITVQ
eukprot:6487042-Amphidinium_carterae.2